MTKSDNKFFRTTCYHVQTSMYMTVLIFFTFKEYRHAACNMMYMYFFGIYFKKKQNVPQKYFKWSAKSVFYIEESFLKERTKLKGNYFKGLGFGVQTKRTSDRVTGETDTFRSICKVILFRLHIYSVNTYHIHITEPFRSGKKAFPFWVVTHYCLISAWYRSWCCCFSMTCE